MWKKIIGILLLVLFVFVGIIFWNTLSLKSKQFKEKPITDIQINANEVAKNLSGAIQFKTISQFSQFYDLGKPFAELHQYLEKAFPLVHQTLQKETVSRYSLVYTWQGKNKNLKPILLMGHLDVVPVDKGSEKDWKFEPFAGEISNGYILGRGTLDDKLAVLGVLEAVEYLLKNKYQPERTIYLAFGHDEEVSGKTGAAQIVKLFQSRKITFEYVLDEGGIVAEGIVPDVSKPVALIGIAEKGYVSIKLSAKGEGGHSSMPPKQTAIGVLSQAIERLEANQMPMRMEGATAQMFDFLAPEMSFLTKMSVANQWLLGGILKNQLGKSNSGNAILRTTTAATVFQAGVKDNVLPISAEATVNFRILPGDTPEKVKTHVISTINNPTIKVDYNKETANLPSPVSDTKTWGFQTIQKTIHQIIPDAVVSPNLVVGATDGRYFTPICKNIYRFIPVRLQSEDLKRIHGTNEQISIKNYAECVRFYVQLIRNSGQKG